MRTGSSFSTRPAAGITSCQPNSLSSTRFEDFVDACGRGKVVRICDFIFTGLYSDVCYVTADGQAAGFNDYNSITILGCYLQGRSVDQCLSEFNPDRFGRPGLDKTWKQAISSIRAHDSQVDIPAAELTEFCIKH